MFKKIFALSVLAAALVGCSKENNVVPAPEKGGQTLTITATIGGPDSKLYYEENEANGFTAKFRTEDRVQLYFLKADNTVAASRILNIDPYSISEDGKSAKFEITELEIPTDAASIFAYLDYNGAGVAYTESGADADLSLQPALDKAQSHQILSGTANMADLNTTSPGAVAAKIKFRYKTSLLRFSLTFPEVVPTSDANTKITVLCPGLHNKLDVLWGELTQKSTLGEITFNPYSVDKDKFMAKGIICIWAADDLKDAKIIASIGEENYGVDLKLLKTALEPGKVYDVIRELKLLPKPVSIWTNDEAGEKPFKSGGSQIIDNGWLSYKDGVVKWTANDTGAPRNGELKFANGSVFGITQISPADFKGEYSLTSKIFASATAPIKPGNPGTISVDFTSPLKGETLPDIDGKSYNNQLGIKGLYGDAIMDATIVIDYENKSVKAGMFLDARSTAGQLHNNSKLATHPYACFLPGMATTSSKALWAAPWNFVQPNLSTDDAKDYTWLWFSVSEDFTTLNYSPNSAESIQYLGTDAKTAANAICGITVAVSTTASIDPTNVRANWEMVYQGNKFATNDGITFKRK